MLAGSDMVSVLARRELRSILSLWNARSRIKLVARETKRSRGFTPGGGWASRKAQKRVEGSTMDGFL